MNKAQLKRFKGLLEEKRDEILKKAKQTLTEDMALDASDLPDEMDLASSEYLQSFTFRLRGREKGFLDKIDKALVKIEAGTFGMCETCEEEISPNASKPAPKRHFAFVAKKTKSARKKTSGGSKNPLWMNHFRSRAEDPRCRFPIRFANNGLCVTFRPSRYVRANHSLRASRLVRRLQDQDPQPNHCMPRRPGCVRSRQPYCQHLEDSSARQ